MTPLARLLLVAALLLSAACADRPGRPGIHFDPTQTRSGDTIGQLVVDSIGFHRGADSVVYGSARFAGQIEISGRTMRTPDADLRDRVLCFEADSTSARQLPRWEGDERRTWFCFENQDEAQRAIGPPSEGTGARVAIDRYTIHRGASDEVNSARLVRAIH